MMLGCTLRIKLTDAQYSALECSGIEFPDNADERALAAAWQDGYLVVPPEARDNIRWALIEFSNSEDGIAEDRNRDKDERSGARGAAKALCNLSSKLY